MTLALALMPKIVVSGADTSYDIRFLAADGGSLSDDFQFDPHAPTFFVVSGFRDTGLSDASLRQANAIQQSLPQANVIVVAWCLTPPSEEQGDMQKKKSLFDIQAIPNLIREYHDSARAAMSVGRDIAECIKQNGISPHRTVITGHSLGAQVAAYASNECTRPEMCSAPVLAIIAADPAGPSFELCSPEMRLDPADAQHVVVVHTTEVFGDEHPVGTADLYLDWPEAEVRNDVLLHSLARELVTAAFQLANTSTSERVTRSKVALDLELVRSLSPSSDGRDALDSYLREVVLEIEIILCELGSDTLQSEEQ
jgi:hypothetical protein